MILAHDILTAYMSHWGEKGDICKLELLLMLSNRTFCDDKNVLYVCYPMYTGHMGLLSTRNEVNVTEKLTFT